MDFPGSLSRAPSPAQHSIAFDGRDEQSIAPAFSELQAITPKLDGLVIASGLAGQRQPIADWDVRDIDEILNGNLRLMPLCLRAALPLLRHSIEHGWSLRFIEQMPLDAGGLCGLPRYAEHDRQVFDAVIDSAYRIAEERFAPFAAACDVDEPRAVDDRVWMIPETVTMADIRPVVIWLAATSLMSAWPMAAAWNSAASAVIE